MFSGRSKHCLPLFPHQSRVFTTTQGLYFQITRLESPWGTCNDKEDHFDNKGYMTMKECYLDQVHNAEQLIFSCMQYRGYLINPITSPLNVTNFFSFFFFSLNKFLFAEPTLKAYIKHQ